MIAQVELYEATADDDHPYAGIEQYVEANKAGFPTIKPEHYGHDEHFRDTVVIPAFLEAHQSVHPEAFLDPNTRGILCEVCWTERFPNEPFPTR